MSTGTAVTFTVNGKPITDRVPARWSLADYLRERLRLTGTHLGCEQGVCGACTVLVDGRSMRACLMLAVQADGTRVRTVEDLAAPEEPWHPLQAAFDRNDALQCGFCTPGFLMAGVELLERPSLTEADVRAALSGNLCRCTGYEGIVRAVLETHGGGDPAGTPAHAYRTRPFDDIVAPDAAPPVADTVRRPKRVPVWIGAAALAVAVASVLAWRRRKA